MEDRNGQQIHDIFDEKEKLAKDLSIAELIVNYLRDRKLMELMTTYVKMKMGDGEFKKSDADALKLKESGNRAYKARKFKEPLKYYNDSIVIGTPSSLAVAYSNRSAVLFEMKEFKQCLTDIERALSYECNDQLKLKLFLRRAKCHIKLNCTENAKENLECIEFWLENAEIPEGKKKDTEKEIAKLREEMGCCSVQSTPTAKLQLSYGSHVNIPPLSAAVDVLYSEEKGRRAVANRSLHPGEVVLIEKPFVRILTKHQTDHCWNCTAATLMSTVPCPYCSQVRFCSEECRDEAWRKHHSFECGYQAFLQHLSFSLIPLRILLAAGIENILDMKKELEKRHEKQLPGFNEKGEFEPSNYYAVYHLTRFNEDTDIFVKQHVVNAAIYFLTFLDLLYPTKIDNLEIENHLKQSRKDKINFTWKERIFLANILARHYLATKCNARGLDKLVRIPSENSPIGTMNSIRLATSLDVVTDSFFNHSCDPNISLKNVASLTVLKVNREVAKGEELCVTYGPRIYEKTRDERQAYLQSNFCFSCKCSACEREKIVPEISLHELCRNFDAVMPKIHRSFSQDQVTSTMSLCFKFADAVTKFQAGDFAEGLMHFSRCLDQIEKHSDFTLSTKLMEIQSEMISCMEQLVMQVNDSSRASFDGSRPPNLTLLLDAVDHGLKCLPTIDCKFTSLESDFSAGMVLRYVRLLLMMEDELRRNQRWINLAKKGQELMEEVKIYFNRNSDGEVEIGYVNDIDKLLNKCVNKV